MNFPHLSIDNEINQKTSFQRTDSIYTMRVTDSSMERFHIPTNAILTVDRSIIPDHEHFVVIEINGQKNIRRLVKAPRTWVLESGYEKPVVIDRATTHFYGVVTKIIINPK